MKMFIYACHFITPYRNYCKNTSARIPVDNIKYQYQEGTRNAKTKSLKGNKTVTINSKQTGLKLV